ncbi:MAG: GPR endopeptidase [Clostridia bacterium]|nr:GPR endopeptidase [Clostridia bacterium]
MERAITDLAVEARDEYIEKYAEGHSGEIDGVAFCEREEEGVKISEIDVLNEEGERAVGRRRGKYVTVAFRDLAAADLASFSSLCTLCARELEKLCHGACGELKSVLVCGIGNARLAADAIGPEALAHVLVTRSLKEREPEIFEKGGFFDVCAIAPGVGADTGFAAADIVRAAVQTAKPDVVIAIDALAARSTERLCKTLQICTAGISPGSGVGNAREALTHESMGVPVISLGVPTVVDVGTLVRDATGGAEHGEKYRGFFVCPKEIDAQSVKIARLLGFTVNMAFQKNYPFGEMLCP